MDISVIDNWFTYHAPTLAQLVAYQRLRTEALQFAKAINALVPDCADKTAAIRKVREAVMTANAGIACEGGMIRSKQVPERTISDECKWCAEGQPEWSNDAKCWIHRRPQLDRRCTRKILSPVGEYAE